MSGYVYLIGNSKFGWYKIGKSIKPEIRVNTLGILLPFKVKIYGIWKAENHNLLETSLHEKYKINKINGEWFNFTVNEMKTIFEYIPKVACVYCFLEENKDSNFAKFSNIDVDKKNGRLITNVRRQRKLTLSVEERETRKLLSMQDQQLNKILKTAQLKFDF